MSLNIYKENKIIRIRYQDSERSGEVIINLDEDKVVIHQTRNIRIILETPGRFSQEIENEKLKHKPDIKRLKSLIKKEIIQLLIKNEAFSPEKSLSLNDILEIAQYEKEAYPNINNFIHESGGLSNAKRLLALIIAALRREGRLAKTEVNTIHGKIVKYYLLQR